MSPNKTGHELLRVLGVRVAVISSPLLSLVLGFVGIQNLPGNDGANFVIALTNGHMFGALFGVALSLALIAQSHVPTPTVSAVQLAALTACTTAFGASWGLSSALLCGSACIAGYFDLYAQRFHSGLVIRLRLLQAAVLISIIAAVLLFEQARNLHLLVQARALVNLLSLGFLWAAWTSAHDVRQPTPQGEPVSPHFSFRAAAGSYFWVAGANGIFIVPCQMLAMSSTSGSYAFLAYALQTALQFGGRMSDYLTVNALQRRPLRAKELSFTFVIMIVIESALIFPPHKGVGIATHLKFTAFVVIAIGTALWAISNSRLTVEIFKGGASFLHAGRSGILGLLGAMGVGSLAFLAGQGALWRPVLLLLAALVGCAIYTIASKRRSAETA